MNILYKTTLILALSVAIPAAASARKAKKTGTTPADTTATTGKGQKLQVSIVPITADEGLSNGIMSMSGKKGVSFETPAGDFLFKPYSLIQTSAKFNYYDSEGIDLADQDRVANTGFEIPNAIIGFSGRAFRIVNFNIALNAAKGGGALLQQAWFDVRISEGFRVRAGKFKTPYTQAYLVNLGETLFPVLPTSLTAPVVINQSINAVNPQFATGFDLGVQFHGLFGDGRWEYRAGVFNGTGIEVNGAKNTVSDDLNIPSLLYAGRLAWTPRGAIPAHQGDPDDLRSDKLLFAVSGSYNVEANYESSNDLRLGAEFVWLKNRLYLAAEAYAMQMKFTQRQQIAQPYWFWGGYVEAGYFVTPKLQPAVRYDFMDRNSTSEKGFLDMPAVGLNWYAYRSNLKLQAMYQYTGRWGHANQDSRDRDDLGLPMHAVTVMLQFSF